MTRLYQLWDQIETWGLQGHQGRHGHWLHDDDNDEEEYNEVEDNNKDDDNNKDNNNDKGISSLGLDRDMAFLQGPSYWTPNDLIRFAHIPQGIG